MLLGTTPFPKKKVCLAGNALAEGRTTVSHMQTLCLLDLGAKEKGRIQRE